MCVLILVTTIIIYNGKKLMLLIYYIEMSMSKYVWLIFTNHKNAKLVDKINSRLNEDVNLTRCGRYIISLYIQLLNIN